MADLGVHVRPDLAQRRRASGTVLISSSGSPSSSSSLSASMMRARLSDNSGGGGGNNAGLLPDPSFLNVSQRSNSSSPRVSSRRPSDMHGLGRSDATAFADDDDDVDEPSLAKHLHLTKLTRSASSSNPVLKDANQISTPLARPQTGRSVSSSVGGSVVGNSTSTTSPLTTPGDGPTLDPLAMAVPLKGKLSANPTSASALEMPRPFDEVTADQPSFAVDQSTDGRNAAKENVQGRHGAAAEQDSLQQQWKAQRQTSVPRRSWAANMITNNVADHQSTAASTDTWSRDTGDPSRKGGAGVIETAHLTGGRGNKSSDNRDKVTYSAAGEEGHPTPISAAPSAPLLSKDVQQITTQPPRSTKHSGGGGDTDGAGATAIHSDGYLRSSSSLAEDADAPLQRRTASPSSLAHSPTDRRSQEQHESMTYPLVPGEATASGSFESMSSSSIEGQQGQQQQGQQQERHRSTASNDSAAGAASVSPSTAADSPQFVAQTQDMFGHVHIPPQVLQQQQHQQQQLYGSSFGPYSTSSASRSPMTTIQPIEAGITSSYDVFRTANIADPYASSYSMPIHQNALPPGSTPQSPAFGPHLTTQPGMPSDSSLYMYTTASVMPASNYGRPPPAMMPSSVMSGQTTVHVAAAQNAATPMMLHGVPASIVPQTPMMMATPPMDRHSRRDSHLSQGALPHSVPPQFMQNTWGSMTLPNTLGTAAGAGQGFVHSHSPSWPAAGDLRSVMGGTGVNPAAHRRMISGPFHGSYVHQQPGSPPSFVRQHGMSGGTRSPHSRTPSTLSFSSSYGRLPMGAEAVQYRSPLLEEFRSRHNRGKRFELQDLRGAVVEFSSDQHGSRFTQEKLTTATDEELQMVFDEIHPHARTLMTDVFGNYVVQKLIEHGTPEMRSELCKQIYGHVLTLSLSTYGCRVVQRALDFVEMHEKMAIAVELKDYILQCVRDQNANHVVQKILERVSPTTQVDFIPAAFLNNTYMLSSHCYSCRVLQRIFEHCEEEQKRPLMEELLVHASELMHDQYGNYVIQWILRNADRADKDRVINLAKGNILHLSRHKFASNVVEQIIAASSQEDRYAFTEEIMEIVNPDEVGAAAPGAAMTAPAYATNSPGEAVSAAELMMRDQFGNYVLQRFLEHAEGVQKQRLVVSIKRALTSMKRFTTGAYTKHLAAIERLLEANVARSNAGTMTNPASNVHPDMSTAGHAP